MSRSFTSWCLFAVLTSCVLGWAPEATASPWVLPKDELALTFSYDVQFASEEYLPNNERQVYPLEGQFSSNSLRLQLRYGFARKFEGFMSASFKHVAYTSRDYLKGLHDVPTIENTRGRLLSFSGTSTGPGDMYLGGRYSLFTGAHAGSLEFRTKVPLGYDAPNGYTVVRGDGVTDLTASLLLGSFISKTRTFGRLDMGYSYRISAGQQVVGEAKLGQFIGRKLIAFASLAGAYTTVGGEVVDGGINFVSIDPGQSYENFGPEDFEERPFYLDNSWLTMGGGIIYRFETFDAQFDYSHVFMGSNIAAIHKFGLSLSFSVKDLMGD